MPKESFIREIEEQAALYALSALPADEANSFQQRVASGCSLCRQLVEECAQTIAMLPLTIPDAAPPDRLRGRLLERIGAVEKTPITPPSAGLLVRPDDTQWQQAPVPGVEIRQLLGSRSMLVRMAPGTTYPLHEHTSGEQCLVLEGSIRSPEMTANAGDFTYFPAGTIHSPLYTETGCLLFIAYG